MCSFANRTRDLKRFLGSNRRRKTCCGEGFLANEGTSDQLTCCQGAFGYPKRGRLGTTGVGHLSRCKKSHDVSSALLYFYASVRGLASAAHMWPWPRGWRGTMATGSRLQGLPWLGATNRADMGHRVHRGSRWRARRSWVVGPPWPAMAVW